MQPIPSPVAIHLPIDRSLIGARRAAHVFMACHFAARRLDAAVRIQADYRNYERVGWTFYVKDNLTALRLALCHRAVMEGRPLPLP